MVVYRILKGVLFIGVAMGATASVLPAHEQAGAGPFPPPHNLCVCACVSPPPTPEWVATHPRGGRSRPTQDGVGRGPPKTG